MTAQTTSYIHEERVIVNGNSYPEEDRFVQRVSHLPMVALTLARLAEVYEKTKLRNAVLRAALEKGEETMLTSWALAATIANKTGLQGPLDAADSSACYFLSKVEEKLPIITYTPDEIAYSGRRMYEDKVQPRVDRLVNMKDNSVRKYNDAKQFGVDKLEEARQMGASTVKTVFDVPVNRMNQSVEWSLNTADALVDKILPEGADAYYDSERPELYDGNLDHAKLLSHKLRQRILSRIAENAHAASLLAQAFQVVDALKNTSAAASLNQVLDNIRRLSSSGNHEMNGNGNVHGEEVSENNVRRLALSLVKKLSAQLKEKVEASGPLVMRYLPQPVNDRIEKVSDMARDVYQQVFQAHTIDELPQSLVGQVHNYVHTLHVTMNSALDVLTETYLLKWLVPEYNNIGSLDIHIQ